MKFFHLILFSFILYGHARIFSQKTAKFDKLRMTPKSVDVMKNLHKNCYYTAVKAIIGKLGSALYKELPKMEQKFLARCLDKIEDRRELITSAKCVVTARKRLLKMKAEMTKSHLLSSTPRPPQHWKAFLQKFDDFDRLHSFTSQSETFESNSTANSTSTFVPFKQPMNGIFKEKNANENFPFSQQKKPAEIYKKVGAFIVANLEAQNPPLPRQTSKYARLRHRILHKNFKKFHVLNEKKKVKENNFMTKRKSKKLSRISIRKLRPLPLSSFRYKRSLIFPDSKNLYYKEAKFKVVTKNEINELSEKQKTDNPIISSITNIIREFTAEDSEGSREDEDKGNEHLKWTKTYNRLMKVRNAIDEQKRVPGAKVYEHRMYDLVLERDEPSLAPSERHSTNGIMHNSMKLLQKLTSTSKNDSSVFYRALSPRFMPLMPLNEGRREPDTFLSPTILAMYDEPKKSNEFHVASVPGMLQSIGVSKMDRDKILQLLMDLSGSNTHVDEALKIYETLGIFDEDIGEPLLNATEKIMNAFERLEHSLFPDQKFHFDNRGFAFLKKHQIQKLMKDQVETFRKGLKVTKRINFMNKNEMMQVLYGHTDDEIDLADFDIYDQMSDEEMEISLWKTIENIAMNKTDVLRPSEAYKRRRKRNMIYILQPTILSPFMFTVQKGVSIAGPLILSPTAFAPPILNPSVASPWILSPGMFDPFILSPYILCPFVLGPLAFTPFILTPYFLSPNILNPYVLSSMILSPIGLSPDILSPQAIAATVLSPSILSPPILTPTIYTASVLSPSFLS